MAYRDAAPLLFDLAARTSTGRMRAHNEDAFSLGSPGLIVAHGPLSSHARRVSTAVLFGVYDGLGRSPAGETASSIAAHTIVAKLQPNWPFAGREHLAQELVLAMQAANHAIFSNALADRSRRGLGTTATVAAAIDRHVALAHVGDTRAYLLRDRHLRQITRDHSLVNDLVEAGHLTPAEAETFEHKNVINRALGVSGTVKVDTYSVALDPGDVILLCTDGVHGLLVEARLQAILLGSTDPAECAAKLVEAAEEAGGYDNETAIVAVARPLT